MEYIHKNLQYTTKTDYRSGFLLKNVIRADEPLIVIPFSLMINSYNIRNNQWPDFITFENFDELKEKFDSGDQWDIHAICLYLFLIKASKILNNTDNISHGGVLEKKESATLHTRNEDNENESNKNGFNENESNERKETATERLKEKYENEEHNGTEAENKSYINGFTNENLANVNASEIIKRYVQYIPKDFPTIPIWMNDDDLSLLKGTHLYLATIKLREKLSSFHEWLLNQEFVKKDPILNNNITIQEIMWAYSSIWSRVFPIHMPDENSPVIPTLLPIVDTMNHRYATKRTYLADYQEKCFILRTDEDITEIGKEVFNNYGAKSNESFLYSYGFIQPNNQHDTYFIQLGFSNIIDPYSREVLMEWNQDILKRKFRFYLQFGKSIPDDLWKTMRVCLLNDQEQYFLSLKKEDDDWLGFVSFRNELEVLTTLRRLFVQRLNEMPFDANHDLKRLQSGECSLNEYNILIYRSSQQRMVIECIEEIDRKLDYLHKSFFALLQDLEMPVVAENPFPIHPNMSEFLPKNCFLGKNGIELYTSRVIGNVVGHIHQQHILHPSNFSNTEIGTFLNEECDVSSNRILLVIWILIQKFVFPIIDLQSHWSHFFSMLPDSFGSLLEEVINHPEDLEIDEDSYSIDLIDEIQEIISEIKTQHNYISKKLVQYESKWTALSATAQKVLKEFKKILSVDTVMWAYLAREYCLVRTDYGDVIAAFPFTLRKKPNAYLASDEASSILQLNIRIPSLCENVNVSSNNWMFCMNQELAIVHGCLIDQNPLDFIFIELEMTQLQERRKSRALRHAKLSKEHYLDWNHEPIKLVNTICIAFMDDDELKAKLNPSKVWSHIHEFEEARSYTLNLLKQMLKEATYTGSNNLIKSYVNLQTKLIEENIKKIEKF